MLQTPSYSSGYSLGPLLPPLLQGVALICVPFAWVGGESGTLERAEHTKPVRWCPKALPVINFPECKLQHQRMAYAQDTSKYSLISNKAHQPVQLLRLGCSTLALARDRAAQLE